MANLSGFNAEEVEPTQSYEPLPAGWYQAIITDSSISANRAGNGQLLKFTIDVVDDEYAGRKVFENLNIEHPNDKAVEIAQRKLSSVCRACGIMTPDDSEELHNIPMWIKVKVRPPKDGYEASNEVAEYAPMEGGGGAGQQQQKQANSGGSKPPWKK